MYLSPLGDTGDEVYPWVYYLLGIDNRQYATYYGVQTSDNGINLSDYSYMGKIEPWRPTTFFYPVEYNVYGNEQAPRISYKYIDGQWEKQYKFYDYLGSLKFTLNHTWQLINYKTYEAFGDTMLDTLGVTRQGIQKLTMNRLENITNYTIGNCQLSILNFKLAIDPL